MNWEELVDLAQTVCLLTLALGQIYALWLLRTELRGAGEALRQVIARLDAIERRNQR